MTDIVVPRFIRASATDPWVNMAWEEYLLHHVPEGGVIFYLWQVQDTVMLGKHQNAWKECDFSRLERDGGKLARRISGGGAVFQDLGTINFTFIAAKNVYDQEKQLRTVLNAVRRLGVDAAFTGRNDLTVNGRKFSGNAFCVTSRGVLHHGTLLINTDLAKMSAYLRVSREKMALNGFASVRSRVVNLTEVNSRITVDTVAQALRDSYTAVYGRGIDDAPLVPHPAEFRHLYAKHASWRWRYGESPEFAITYRHRFAWGELDINLNVEDGVITEVKIYSDALDSRLIDHLTVILRGIPFRKDAVLEKMAAEATPGEANIFGEIGAWLNTRLA